MPPTVRSLDELMKYTAANYDPQRQMYQQQIAQTNQQLPELEAPIYAARDRAFKDISQLASNKGMLFSGFSPSQQAKYTGEKFLPALTNLRSKVQDNIGRLQGALLNLDSEQRKEAMGLHEGDLGKLYSFQQEQDRRKWEKEQSETAYQREMEALRQKQAFEASQNKAAQAASAPGKPGSDFLGYLSQQFAAAGGQGNKNISRQQQDQWANQWFLDQGIMDPAARQYFWDLFNTTYKRSSDPKKDWRYKR